jgi:hypothetical protein
MKNQTADFQLDPRTSEADAAFVQTSQLKPDAFTSGFKKGSLKRNRNHLSVAALVMLLPSFLNATCIPSAPAGYTVPFSLVTLKNNQHASYASGVLTISDAHNLFESFTTLSATKVPQLFSDRFVPVTCRPGALCGPGDQPFDINQADQLGVTITETSRGIPVSTTINVTLTLESWGNGTGTFSGTCDASTGELYGTYSDDNFVVITFGTPEAPIGPPK